MKLIKITLSIALVAFFMQSCEDIYTDPTYMEDYLEAPVFTPDNIYKAKDLFEWDKLPNDGEDEYYPYIYQVTNKPGSMIYRKGYGIRLDAYGGWWDQRSIRTGFEVNGDFEIEFKARIVSGTGDAVWQKGGIIVGDIGGAPANLWLSLENPVEVNHGRVNRFIPGSEIEWFNMDEGNFSVFDWQVIKAVRVGNTLSIYRDGNLIDTYTHESVGNINGKVGISAEALSVEYEYLTVNGNKDDFTNMDNWSNLDKIPVVPPSEWTLNDTILNVVASYGWNHRAVNGVIPGDFTVETKVRINSTNSTYPMVGIMVGELGDGVPAFIYSLDANKDINNGSSVTKYFPARPGGEWSSIVPNDFNSKDWHTLRLRKVNDVMYVYVDGVRQSFEKGDYISNISGKIGLFAMGCDADYEYVSIKAE